MLRGKNRGYFRMMRCDDAYSVQNQKAFELVYHKPEGFKTKYTQNV
jgi:hypothetical protein